VRVIAENACVLGVVFSITRLQHRRRQHIRSPTGSARANERHPASCVRRIRKRELRVLPCPTLINRHDRIPSACCRDFGPPDPEDTFRASYQSSRDQQSSRSRLCPVREQRCSSSPAICVCVARKTILGQPVWVGLAIQVCRYGRLPHLVGRGRALQSPRRDDFDVDTRTIRILHRALPDAD